MTYEPKERQILDQVVAALHGHYGERLSKVVLFGSRARRDHVAESDYDILVVLNGGFDPRAEREALHEIVYPIDYAQDTVVFCLPVEERRYQSEQTAFMMNVRAEGISL